MRECGILILGLSALSNWGCISQSTKCHPVHARVQPWSWLSPMQVEANFVSSKKEQQRRDELFHLTARSNSSKSAVTTGEGMLRNLNLKKGSGGRKRWLIHLVEMLNFMASVFESLIKRPMNFQYVALFAWFDVGQNLQMVSEVQQRPFKYSHFPQWVGFFAHSPYWCRVLG